MSDVLGGPGWVIRGSDLRPVITDVAAFRAGRGGDPLGPAIEALWSGHPATALTLLSSVTGRDARVRALRADCLRDLGDHDGALAAYDALVEECTGTSLEPTLRQHRAKTLLTRGSALAAIADLELAALARWRHEPLLASTMQTLAVARRMLACDERAIRGWAQEAVNVGLGLEVATVHLAAHDRRWPSAFDDLHRVLEPWLHPTALAVEHVGSTAVTELHAKPVLDVAIAVAPTADVEPVVDALVAAGCIDRGAIDAAGGDRMLAIESAPEVRVAHVHLMVIDGAQWRGYVDLRDALRASPVARRRYEAVKLRLHEEGLPRAAYRRAKAAVIEQIVAQHRAP